MELPEKVTAKYSETEKREDFYMLHTAWRVKA